jgi:hypothetical protein
MKKAFEKSLKIGGRANVGVLLRDSVNLIETDAKSNWLHPFGQMMLLTNKLSSVEVIKEAFSLQFLQKSRVKEFFSPFPFDGRHPLGDFFNRQTHSC